MKAALAFVANFFIHLVTDAAGRTEPKLILAYVFAAIGIYKYISPAGSALEFVILETFACGLLGVTSVADHHIDMVSIEAEKPEEPEKRVGFDTRLDHESGD